MQISQKYSHSTNLPHKSQHWFVCALSVVSVYACFEIVCVWPGSGVQLLPVCQLLTLELCAMVAMVLLFLFLRLKLFSSKAALL